MITNKTKLIEVLTSNCGPSQLYITPFIECLNVEEKIVLDEDNNAYEIFEIFVAILANLHNHAIKEDDFELAKLVTKTYNHQYKQMKRETDAGGDEDTMWWLYFIDEYYQQTIQLQLTNYTK
jgi:hypothetical protein